jgi:hypothetical protein
MVLFGAGLCLAQDSRPPLRPTGKVRLTLGQGGLLLSASAGRGVLTFNHKVYPFKMGGLGFGEIGASRVDAQGVVYNLDRLEDFTGTYVQLKTGYAGGSGTGEIWLKNSNGVEIELGSRMQGLELTMEAEGVVIEFARGKK